MSIIMIRKTTVKDTDTKLKLALTELKKSKEEISQLLKERVDIEEEIRKINDKNSHLKAELVRLHTVNMDLLEQRSRLQVEIDSFSSCFNTYLQSLNRISELERSLQDAHNTNISYEQKIQALNCIVTQSLYSELLGNSPHVFKCKKCSHIAIGIKSHKKVRKHRTINKLVRKLESDLKKCQKTKILCLKNSELMEERNVLLSDLQRCKEQLDSNKISYEQHILALKAQIVNLQAELNTMAFNYENEKYQCKLKCEKYAKLDKESTKQIRTLDKKDICSNRLQQVLPVGQLDPCIIKPHIEINEIGNNKNNCICTNIGHSSFLSKSVPHSVKKRVIIFSDHLGVGFGSLLKCHIKYPIVNICSPGITLSKLINDLNTYNLEVQSTVVILFGDSMSASKRGIIKLIEVMLALHSRIGCKFIVCALPYSNLLTENQNMCVHNLNLLMYKETQHYGDRIYFFDTNKFIKDGILTEDGIYLSLHYRRQLAKLLAFYIMHTDSDKLLTESKSYDAQRVPNNLFHDSNNDSNEFNIDTSIS